MRVHCVDVCMLGFLYAWMCVCVNVYPCMYVCMYVCRPRLAELSLLGALGCGSFLLGLAKPTIHKSVLFLKKFTHME